MSTLLDVRNPQQRLAVIVERARRRPSLDASRRIDAHRVEGCLVRTWFIAEMRDGRCSFIMDSDAVTLKALLGLLCDIYSGFPPDEIALTAPDFLQRVGVMHQLAENRQRTVMRIAKQIHEFAVRQLRLVA